MWGPVLFWGYEVVNPDSHGGRRKFSWPAAFTLTGTACTADDPAMASGFTDQSHLSRVFLKFLGVTPNNFRNSA